MLDDGMTEQNVKVSQKNAQLVSEMDLSQFDLKAVPSLVRFKFLKFLDVSCNQIEKLENLKFRVSSVFEAALIRNKKDSVFIFALRI